MTRAHSDVVGRVRGNHDLDTPAELARRARPRLDAHALTQHQSVCDEIRELMGTHAVSGIHATRTAGRDGRGYRLVVEDGYRFPGRVVDGVLHVATADEPHAFDAVDETVNSVVRHGGEVIPVAAGSLANLGHIALQVRS